MFKSNVAKQNYSGKWKTEIVLNLPIWQQRQSIDYRSLPNTDPIEHVESLMNR
jgi:hypothetical protein